MSVAVLPVEGEFRISGVLNGAWAVFAANLPFFLSISLIVALPNVLLLLAQARGAPRVLWPVPLAVNFGLVLHLIGQAVILVAAFQHMRGEPVRVGEALRRGLARFFPLLGLAILGGLAMTCGFVLLFVPAFLFPRLFVFVASCAFILFIVAGCILLTMWLVVVPACVVEGLGPIASAGRSRQLTKGQRWAIFGTLLLMLIISGVVNLIVGFVLASAGFYFVFLGKLIWLGIWTAFWNCILVMIYHDLRVAKEGIDTVRIASVFD